EIEESGELDRLKRQLNQLSRQLYEVKHKRADYLQAVHDAVEESISAIRLDPVKAPKLVKAGPGSPEVAVAMLSDTQTGKVTPDYNSEVCAERVSLYAEKIIRLSSIQEM